MDATKTRNVPNSVSEYAAKFGVSITIEQYGIYGDAFDYVARPGKPTWYPTVGDFRVPIGTDPKSAIRAIAERMGTGKYGPRGFVVVK